MGDSNQVVDRAFNQAFTLITRAYITLTCGDVQEERLQILNKIDLRKDRPGVGWALQEKYDEKKRERLTRAEKALHDARREVVAAETAHQGDAASRAQQRRLTLARL